MKVQRLFIILFLQIALLNDARGMWMRYQTELVPIDRVLRNMELRLQKNTNDVETLYDLARIHSTAYSTNLLKVEVRTNDSELTFVSPFGRDVPQTIQHQSDPRLATAAQQHLTNAIFYYQRAATAIFKGTNSTALRWLISPIHLGLAWSLDQAGRRDEAITAYRKALQLAWAMEVDQEPSIKEQAVWSWDQIRARQNPFTRPPKFLGPGICFSEEIIGYLLKLLDPAKDAKEIAQLRKDLLTIQSMGRAITPILVSVTDDAPLEELVNPSANVTFDLDGSGLPRRWGWITPKAAWLVFDYDGSGTITSGLQMFGNATFWIFWRNGYAALAALDDNQDGVLRGEELRGISLWQDLNGNGICDPGEVRLVTDWGIVEIDCRGQVHATGIPYNPRGVVFRDGHARATFDWIAESPAPEL